MKTFVHYLKSLTKGSGSSRGTLNLITTTWIFVPFIFVRSFNGVIRYFTFKVLPLCLSCACFCFTKLVRPLVRRCRSMGHDSFVYLDDIGLRKIEIRRNSRRNGITYTQIFISYQKKQSKHHFACLLLIIFYMSCLLDYLNRLFTKWISPILILSSCCQFHD